MTTLESYKSVYLIENEELQKKLTDKTFTCPCCLDSKNLKTKPFPRLSTTLVRCSECEVSTVGVSEKMIGKNNLNEFIQYGTLSAEWSLFN